MFALSPDEIRTFRERGFLGPYDLMPAADAARAWDHISREVLPSVSPVYAHTQADPPLLNRVRDRHLDSALVYRACVAEQILARVTSLVGPDVLLFRSDFFVQGPNDPVTALHQDNKFTGRRNIPAVELPDGGTPFVLTAWVGFTRITESGGLNLIPGSHLEGELPQVSGEGVMGKPTRLGREYAPSQHHVVTLNAGQFMLFDNLVVHGSNPVVDDGEPRAALSIRFVASSALVYPRGLAANGNGQELSRFGSLLVAGVDRHQRNVLRAPPVEPWPSQRTK